MDYKKSVVSRLQCAKQQVCARTLAATGGGNEHLGPPARYHPPGMNRTHEQGVPAMDDEHGSTKHPGCGLVLLAILPLALLLLFFLFVIVRAASGM